MSDQGAAEQLLNHPLLKEIFDKLERSAMERAINAKPADDEQRRICTQEVRAIRAVRRELSLRAEGKTNP